MVVKQEEKLLWSKDKSLKCFFNLTCIDLCFKKSVAALFITLGLLLTTDSGESGQCESVMILHWQETQPMHS